MTLFGLYRVLEFPGVLSTKTITDSGKVVPMEFIEAFKDFIFNVFYREAIRRVRRLSKPVSPLLVASTKRDSVVPPEFLPYMRSLKAKPFAINRSSPSTRAEEGRSDISTSFRSLVAAAQA